MKKLSFEEVVALDLQGARARAREGVTQVRGIVRRLLIEDEMLTIDLGEAERRRDRGAWEGIADFDYRGRRDTTSVFQEADGRVSIAIMYIGEIVILPEGRS